MRGLMESLAMRSAQAAGLGMTGIRRGLVTAYDPDSYSVKVQLQPTGEETGWIPLGTVWAGNGWGFAAGPVIGAQVSIDFDSGRAGDGQATVQLYNDEDRCPGPPSGELWMVQKSGSLLKFHNDGTVEVTAAATMKFTASQHHFIGPVQMDNTLQVAQQITGQGGMAVSGGSGAAMTVSGDMHSTGTISADTDVLAAGKSGARHTHADPQGGTVGAPQ